MKYKFAVGEHVKVVSATVQWYYEDLVGAEGVVIAQSNREAEGMYHPSGSDIAYQVELLNDFDLQDSELRAGAVWIVGEEDLQPVLGPVTDEELDAVRQSLSETLRRSAT